MDKILAPIKQRVLQIADLKYNKRKDFFEEIGVSASNFRSKSLYSELSGDIIAKILSQNKDLNPEWLLTGTGSMLRNSNVQKTEQTPVNTNVSVVQDTKCKQQIQLLQQENTFLKENNNQLKENITLLKESKALIEKENARLTVENKQLRQSLQSKQTVLKKGPEFQKT